MARMSCGVRTFGGLLVAGAIIFYFAQVRHFILRELVLSIVHKCVLPCIIKRMAELPSQMRINCETMLPYVRSVSVVSGLIYEDFTGRLMLRAAM